MTESDDARRARVDEVARLLERHRVLESLAGRQHTDRRELLERMQRRENLVELRRHVSGMHPADLAALLARLPTDERRLVFGQLRAREAGLTLVELDQEIRETIVDDLSEDDLTTSVSALDADDLAYLSPWLPAAVIQRASEALGAAGRSWLYDAGAYPEDVVGRLMRQDVVAVRLDQTVGQVIAGLRQRDELPGQTDRLFAVDIRHLLRGTVRLQDLIRADPESPLASILVGDVAAFTPGTSAERAAEAFERYDLVSAPVVDDLGKLIGRITIDAVVDYQRAASDQDALTQAGLRGAEDLFAPVSESIRNRWPWLAVNLLTAFAASRVIGLFEATITQVVALAALMPIVASVGGNTGNQTVALVIRALALDQLRDRQRRLARRELTVGAVNGLAWGLVVGLFALVIYRDLRLAEVMTAAVFLNLIVAALAGVSVPLLLRWAGRDPVHGSSVVLTFVTDGMGFFFFLGLAQLFLV